MGTLIQRRALLAGALAGTALAVAAVGSVASKRGTSPGLTAPTTGSPTSGSFGELRDLTATLDLDRQWTDFLVMVAWNESRGNSDAINDSTSEARAARKAYERNAKHFAACRHAPSAYGFGSGGWFAQLPAVALMQFRSPDLRCIPPRFAVTDPATSLATAVGFARGLMGWSRFQADPRFANLRVMWGSPGKGGDQAFIAAKLPRYRKHARAAGVPPSLLEARPTALGITADQAYSQLKGIA